MRSTTLSSTLLLLVGAAAAQQTTEQVFTIQTSVPAGPSSACYEVCVQEPCYACSSAPPVDLPVPTSVPPVDLPVPTSVSISDLPDSTSVPPVDLPVPTSVSVSDGDATMTLPVESLPSVGSEVTPTPSGETPESTGVLPTLSGSGNVTASASRSAPAEQTTAAAPPSLKRDSATFMLALGVSGVSILFGAAWTVL